MKTLPKVTVSTQTHDRLRALAAQVLAGARGEFPDGTAYWRPDGEGRYDGVWLRDFCYAVEGAADLLPDDAILPVVDLFLRHQRDDGSIPTRVMADGLPDYLEGPREVPIGFGPPTDNPSFLAKTICAYVARTADWCALRDRLHALTLALDSVPRDRDGLVLIDPALPRPGYGFTDCIAKTGKELFSSLLTWEALRRLAETCRQWELHEEAHDWYERAEPLQAAVGEFYQPEWGMFMAATRDGRQIDIWGSAYACVLGATSSKQRGTVTAWLLGRPQAWGWHAHVRHLPAGEHWAKLLTPVEPETYQNGGYWAVATGWIAQVLFTQDRALARGIIEQVLAEFEQFGVMEWIHPERGRHTRSYVASVCNVLASVMPSRKL